MESWDSENWRRQKISREKALGTVLYNREGPKDSPEEAEPRDRAKDTNKAAVIVLGGHLLPQKGFIQACV